MKYSVLDMTQNILSSMDSDEVNSISDTTESLQVANVIRTTYFNIVARADFPELSKIFSLDSSTDTITPTLMVRPENVARMEWIKYNKIVDGIDAFDYVTILPLQQFLDMTHSFNTSDPTVDTMILDDQTFYFRNDKNPDYCTTMGDQLVIFDSYDANLDMVLQTSKTMCYGKMIPDFELSDSFVPELDDRQFQLLLMEAKAVCFMELKQMPSEAASIEARRQWRSLQRTKNFVKPNPLDQFANYAR